MPVIVIWAGHFPWVWVHISTIAGLLLQTVNKYWYGSGLNVVHFLLAPYLASSKLEPSLVSMIFWALF